jgi:fatty acid synthase subunit alpha, fungi type
MDASNVVAHELESYGVRTFSAKEMAFNTLGLMHPLLFSITQVEPIWADLNSEMDRLPDLADITTQRRLTVPVDDKDVRGRYEKEILTHAGVCLIGG